MPKVTFDCTCPQSVVAVTVQESSDPSDVEGLLFKASGSKTIELSKGEHELSYRAVGSPNSHITLSVSKGGSLDRDVNRDLGDDGRGAGLRLVTVGVILLTLLSMNREVAYAQTNSTQPEAPSLFPAPTEAQKKEIKKAVKEDLVTLPAAGTPRVPSVSANFEATSNEKTGAVSIVLAAKNSDAFTAGVTISGPLDDTTKTGEPLSQTGLASGASVAFGLHWFIWKGERNEMAAREICRRNVRTERCDDNEITNPEQRLLFLRALGADTDPIIVDVIATTGRNNFRFLDPASFAASKEQHTDHAFGVSIGRFAPTTGLVTVGYTYGRVWQAASGPRNICTPTSGSTSMECRTAPVGSPAVEDKHEVSVEERIFFFRGRAATAPLVAYDVKGKETTVSVPVYFFVMKDSNLAGGVKASWNSRDQGTTVAVFVGPAFRIFR